VSKRNIKPYREPTVYVSQVTLRQISATRFQVISIPHPVTTVEYHKLADDTWKVRVLGRLDVNPVIVFDQDAARRRAVTWCGRLAGAILQRFTPAQRIILGRQRCPYILNRHSLRLCEERPTVGSIWCEWHPEGRDLADGKLPS